MLDVGIGASHAKARAVYGNDSQAKHVERSCLHGGSGDVADATAEQGKRQAQSRLGKSRAVGRTAERWIKAVDPVFDHAIGADAVAVGVDAIQDSADGVEDAIAPSHAGRARGPGNKGVGNDIATGRDGAG